MVQRRRIDDLLGIGIPDDEVGIPADGDRRPWNDRVPRATPARQPSSAPASRSGRPRIDAPVQTAASAELQRRDAAPGASGNRRREMLERGGAGEWSLAIRSMSPDVRPCQRPSRSRALRIGGAHLNAVAPLAIWSGVEREVVRAGFARDRDAAARARRESPQAAAGDDRCTTWTRAPDSTRQARSAGRRPPCSLAAGRVSSQVRYSARIAGGVRLAQQRGQLGVDQQRDAQGGQDRQRLAEVRLGRRAGTPRRRKGTGSS